MYTQKDFTHLLGMEGFSDALLNNHFTLYKGYIDNVNTLSIKLEEMSKEKLMGDDKRKEELSELRRRYGWEYNGMKLHELYFENLTKAGKSINEEGELYKSLTNMYGKFEVFKDNFLKNIGMIRGIGWVALVLLDNGSLKAIWIGEHDEGLLANSKILLIMDVFEHAFMVDYGLKRADYINSFWNNIDWSVVENRYKA